MTPIDEQRHRVPGAAFFQIEPAGERMSCCSGANRARSRTLSAISPYPAGSNRARALDRGGQAVQLVVACRIEIEGSPVLAAFRGSHLVVATHP